ncbi:NAD(P)-binding protein [Coniophora puteana RWD-64-598 SS2]|uniref:NAD(P)-binding protein n=1 Tax=Coniophora puteana (strain RWD-64-598) TaxID=741705 RepID=A0A5M3MUB8_CONPW|nr:NAD(P)-binding protein [Coniophora puteana RWD-64-598 SS2]EIW82768.1 NAD(P)-binding protein [Coniophora puteana RWD-64-598 SS2]
MLTSKGVALVTGCTGGIGRAVSLRLAADGFDLALNDLPHKRDAVDSIAAELSQVRSGIKTCSALADLRYENEVKDMVASVSDQLGGIDVLVANAGVVRVNALAELSETDWDDAFSINVKGTFFCYKHIGAQMVKQGRGGRIIGMSSLAGKKGFALLGAYCSSKFAVRGLTQVAAAELGSHGITVNACAPGLVETPMLNELHDGILRASGGTVDISATIKQLSTLGTNGQPKDIADLISYLASKEARFITGQTISIDGGVHFD